METFNRHVSNFRHILAGICGKLSHCPKPLITYTIRSQISPCSPAFSYFLSRHLPRYKVVLRLWRTRLKKPTQARLETFWMCACFAYGLLFISYEKVASTHWQKAYIRNNRKTFSIITIIKRLLTDLWNQHFLLSFSHRCVLGGILSRRPVETD